MDTPNIRPLNDVLLVKLEETQKYSETIIIPDSVAQAHPLQLATVVRCGPGRHKLIRANGKETRFVPTTVQAGQRIAFFTVALDTRQGKQLAHALPDGYGLIREEDILFVIEGNEAVRVEVP